MSKAFQIPVLGLENYYATDCGDIYSRKTGRFKKLTQFKNWAGYMRVGLFVNNKRVTYSVHRLIALTFIKNPNNLPQVNHIDGNKSNNNVNNLEWCSLSQNVKHAYKNNLIKPKTTKVIQYTKDMKKIKIWDSINEIEKHLKINHSNIVTVCKQNTNRKYAGGYIWRYE